MCEIKGNSLDNTETNINKEITQEELRARRLAYLDAKKI
jgi:hypothetical protein